MTRKGPEFCNKSSVNKCLYRKGIIKRKGLKDTKNQNNVLGWWTGETCIPLKKIFKCVSNT